MPRYKAVSVQMVLAMSAHVHARIGNGDMPAQRAIGTKPLSGRGNHDEFLGEAGEDIVL